MERQSKSNLSMPVRAIVALCVLGTLTAGVLLGREVRAAPVTQSGEQPTTRSGPPPKIIPWLEVNTANEKEMDVAIRGLRVWQDVTDTAIISTTPGRASLYTKLRAEFPKMKIIAGVKTAGPLRPFDSVDGWRTVAAEVRKVCDATGVKCCVLENETALSDDEVGTRDYWSGKTPIDYDKLKRGLRELPSDVEIWFYPSFITGRDRATYHRQSQLLCQAVQEVLDTRFVETEFTKPAERNDMWNADLAKLRNSIAKKPSIPVIYFVGNKKFWPDDEVKRVLSLVRGDDVIFYPGFSRWVGFAEKTREQLRP